MCCFNYCCLFIFLCELSAKISNYWLIAQHCPCTHTQTSEISGIKSEICWFLWDYCCVIFIQCIKTWNFTGFLKIIDEFSVHKSSSVHILYAILQNYHCQITISQVQKKAIQLQLKNRWWIEYGYFPTFCISKVHLYSFFFCFDEALWWILLW